MPREITIALTVIFALFCLMAVRIAWRIIKDKGGRPMKHKHFNGRFFW